SGLTMPLQSGDGVLLIFADRSLDEWKRSGGPVAPADRRQHELTDAIAVPSLLPFSDAGADPDNVVLYHGTSKIILKENGEVDIGGVVIKDGDVFIDGISMRNHVHSSDGTP